MTIQQTRDRISPAAASSANQSDIKSSSLQFVWGAGIECSFIPHLNIDQFEWTQHDRFWRDDFKRLRQELGIKALRYALPWHKIERERGKFDWAQADERIGAAHDMGIDLYLDVMHFGTPLWLKLGAEDPEFPEALESFAENLVARFSSLVKTWCPCNEPLVLALFSGDFGFWPPHARKWKGYMPVLSRVVQATSRAIRAIKRTDPHATVLLCDNVENYKSRTPELALEVRRRNLRRFLALDLLLGRVDSHHPLFNWVTGYGLSEIDLQWFAANPQRPDVLGIDYYPNSEWQLEKVGGGTIHQRRTESPIGLYGIAKAYYQRYALPMMLTETSADGNGINREIWLDQTVADCRRLREEGIPMRGFFWWPMIDQLDWDGALTHRVGKIHEVGLFNLRRLPDGTLARHATTLVDQYAKIAREGNNAVGELEFISIPSDESDQGPPIGVETANAAVNLIELEQEKASNGNGNGNGKSNGKTTIALDATESAPDSSALSTNTLLDAASSPSKSTGWRGMVVFSHLRWGFVWQRPQQFLSRFARKHRILFVEEPFFDLPAGEEPRVEIHQVMPNVTVACPRLHPSFNKNPKTPELLRKFVREAMDRLNDDGDFDKPLLWYYSPMDSAWSLGYFDHCGVVYDCMDELSQFTGAPKALVENEARFVRHSDIVFTGGYELGEKKSKQHENVHPFGCGVDVAHFAKAADPNTRIPPDIDFMSRPILGWFGVVDERVDYTMIGEMARLRPTWSFAMVGPVVKIDPNLLPHSPNLFWLGGRDYQQLPHYCRAFDVNMMCFAINHATQFINPTKGLEYMATGKPIVSTPVRDVVRQWSDIVRIARTAEEFVAAAENAMRAGNDERIARGIALAERSSWDSTVESMRQLIVEAIGQPDRPSGGKPEPLTKAEIEYVYLATQGS